MNDTPSPFAPFLPSPPSAPEQKAEKPAKEKKPRTPKQPAAQAVFAPTAPTPAEKPARKPRAAKQKTLKAHSPKFDLQTTLAAAQLLNEGDFPLFEKLVVALDEAGKPARDRVLGALSKVFG